MKDEERVQPSEREWTGIIDAVRSKVLQLARGTRRLVGQMNVESGQQPAELHGSGRGSEWPVEVCGALPEPAFA
jgi:hypothetical protein